MESRVDGRGRLGPAVDEVLRIRRQEVLKMRMLREEVLGSRTRRGVPSRSPVAE